MRASATLACATLKCTLLVWVRMTLSVFCCFSLHSCLLCCLHLFPYCLLTDMFFFGCLMLPFGVYLLFRSGLTTSQVHHLHVCLCLVHRFLHEVLFSYAISEHIFHMFSFSRILRTVMQKGNAPYVDQGTLCLHTWSVPMSTLSMSGSSRTFSWRVDWWTWKMNGWRRPRRSIRPDSNICQW